MEILKNLDLWISKNLNYWKFRILEIREIQNLEISDFLFSENLWFPSPQKTGNFIYLKNQIVNKVLIMSKKFERLEEAYQASYDEFRNKIATIYPDLDRWELLTISNFVYDNNINKEDVIKSFTYLTWKREEMTKSIKSLVESLNHVENVRSDITLSKGNVSTLIRKLRYRGISYEEICGIISYGDGENPFTNAEKLCREIHESAKRFLVTHADMEE